MNNKYYTPEVEEFHVGFEYEIFIPEKYEWCKETFYLNQGHIDQIRFVDIQDGSFKNPIRCKYLSHEDILSLGFIQDVRTKHNEYLYTVISEEIDAYKTIYRLTIDFDEIVIEVSDADSYFKGDILFRGDVKNKYELKILLHQLNIQR